jgi:hypothetical protein
MNSNSDSDAKNDKMSNPTNESTQRNGIKLIEKHERIIIRKNNLAFFVTQYMIMGHEH